MGNNKDDFWLDDDPELRALQQRAGVEQNAPAKPETYDYIRSRLAKDAQAVAPPKPGGKKESIIKQFFPKTLPKLRPPRLNRKQIKLATAGTGVVALVLVGAVALSLTRNGTEVEEQQGGVLSDSAQVPPFATLLPPSDSGAVLSGLRYDSDKKVASFTSRVDDVAVTVSQQEMPENFSTNPQEGLKKLAGDIFATEQIELSDGMAFVGKSTNGPQTAIMVREGILIFAHSQREIPEDKWKDFLETIE
ncbi:MAG: hypothetical protein U5K77_00815 [Candidatus Saccharibacteria bacterium]|nr:hypothetical protein [Candidatus Saccharibacteria bacterium]